MAKDLESLIRPGMGMSVISDLSEYDWEAWNGRMMVWEAPMQGEQYALGVDPAEGVGQDNSVCEVIRVGSINRPSEQVAEFACNFMTPPDFANVVNTIGRFYHDADNNEAYCAIECNANCGEVMMTELRLRLEYSNLYIKKDYNRVENLYTNKIGWWTDKKTRPQLIARGLHAFLKGDMIINSEELFKEMSRFEKDHLLANAKAKAASGYHDDRVIAILIAFWAGHEDWWLSGEDIHDERRLRQKGIELQAKMPVTATPSKKKRDFQNQAITLREMWSRADAELLDE